ncbi:hypothetical protein F4811DRAFT_313319 [Daldinia bambusicola]|nr:hypothetical protein F4811DRAFT_313319 [Daldinia bambusicola]
MGVLSHGGFAFRNCIGVHDTTESSGSIWERYDKASSRVMTFEQKKEYHYTYRTSVWRRWGRFLFCLSRQVVLPSGRSCASWQGLFFMGNIRVKENLNTNQTGLGRHSGCLDFIFRAHGTRWELVRAVLWGCKYRAHIYVIILFYLSLINFFFIVIVLRSRDERIPVHFSLSLSLFLGGDFKGEEWGNLRVCVCIGKSTFGRNTKRRRRRNGYTRQLVPLNGCVAFLPVCM